MTSFLQQPLNVRGGLTTSPNILQCLTEKMHGCYTHLKACPALLQSRVEGISKCQEERKKIYVGPNKAKTYLFAFCSTVYELCRGLKATPGRTLLGGGLHLIAGLKVEKSKDKCLVPPAGQ